MVNVTERRSMEKIRLKREGYPYTYARVCARKGRLFSRNEYQKLLKLELNGIIRELQESGYRDAIDSLVGQYAGVDLIERALNFDMVRTAADLRRITAPEVRVLVDAFLQRYDIQNVKTVLRGIAAKRPADEVASFCIPAGNLSQERLLELFELGETAAVLKRVRLPGAAEASVALTRGLVEAENALDKGYFLANLDLAGRITEEGAAFREFLMDEVDVVNLKTLLRLKRHGLQPHELERYLIMGGRFLDAKRLQRLTKADSFDALVGQLRKGPFKDVFASAPTDLVDIELTLEKRLLRRSFLFTRQHPLTVLSILSYLLAKVMELRNLKALVKAKQLGLDEEFIEQKLVV